MNKTRRFAAILVGVVFLASGLLKLLDPVGTGLIVSAYYKFLHLAFLDGTARWAGVALALTESVLGAALITGVARKLTGILSGILIGFFTLVTLALLVANPDMDCGCFGEAVHLTHLESFLKNLVLLALWVLAFRPLKDLGKPSVRRLVAFWAVSAALCVAAVYNQFHLPTVDFTDFAVGNELMASLDNDYEAEDDLVYVHVFERDGQTGFFTANRLPDSTWTFVRVDTVNRNGLKFEEKTPSLSFRDDMGEYRDEDAVLGKVMVLSAYDPGALSREGWDRLTAMKDASERCGMTPILLVAGGPEDEAGVPALLRPYVHYSDFKTLVTLNRSNGGATYLDNGQIVRKWHSLDIPDEAALGKLAETDPVEAAVSGITRGRLRAQGFLLYLAAVLLLL